MTLLSNANAGASGKEATNRDTNPYWITVDNHTDTHKAGAWSQNRALWDHSNKIVKRLL